jgi:hypothetical protein
METEQNAPFATQQSKRQKYRPRRTISLVEGKRRLDLALERLGKKYPVKKDRNRFPVF